MAGADASYQSREWRPVATARHTPTHERLDGPTHRLLGDRSQIKRHTSLSTAPYHELHALVVQSFDPHVHAAVDHSHRTLLPVLLLLLP